MKTFRLLFFTALCGLLISSAPFKPIVKEVGDDLVITLEEGHGILALGWQGKSIKRIDSKIKEVTIKRFGWGGLPTNLVLIPTDRTKQPQSKKIEPSLKKVNISKDWQPLEKDSYVLWGETPRGVCSMFVPLEDTKSSLIIITFPKRSATSTGGFFYLEFKKQKDMFLHLSTNHAKFNLVKTRELNEASDIQKVACQMYYGGPCDVVLSIPEQAYGKSHELKFPKLEKKDIPCPV